MNKTALILGISGGFGGSVARALARQGWQIRTLVRDPARLPERFRGAEVVLGDAGDREIVRQAAAGADLVVYGVNPAGYRWDGVALPMLENTASVAEDLGLTVVFPGNVYVLDPDDGPEFDEGAPLHPVTHLGELRRAMEMRLQRAAQQGARVIVLRMGDFIGAGSRSAWMGQLLRRKGDGYTLSATGPRDLEHSWAYLPDAARVVVALVDKGDELEPYSVFHLRGYRASLRQISDAVREATGKEVRFTGFPWLLVYGMAPFSALFRGLAQMRYLWRRRVNLDEGKLARVLGGSVPRTPLAQALQESGLLTE
jgi:nucleoside-diphosphate-sugar epimerase